MMSAFGVWRGVACGLAVLALNTSVSLAKPLAEETCKILKAEHVALRLGGVLKSMSKGPKWAKANLSDDELGHIKRYLMLQDHIKFRCFPVKRKATPVATKPPQSVPLPTRKRVPQKPAELDMEAIRDQLHGYQDAEPPDSDQDQARPARESGGAKAGGGVTAALPTGSQNAQPSAPPQLQPAALAAPAEESGKLTLTVRDLTPRDLASSAGVLASQDVEEKPSPPVRQRRVGKKSKDDWFSLGIDSLRN